jgi:hypothetical protein
MKQPEYTEGPEALKNFEEGMKALFKAPKVEMVALKKKNAKRPKSATSREEKKTESDKD